MDQIRRRRLQGLAIGVGALLVAALGWGGWCVYAWAAEVDRLNRLADRVPSVEELYDEPIPADENAATVYEQAWKELELSDAEGHLIADRDAKPAKLSAIVERNAGVLALLREAAQRPRCRFEPTFAADGLRDYPHLAELRDLARFTAAAARLAAAEGQGATALNRIRYGLRMGDHLLRSADSLIVYLTGVAIVAINTDAARDVVCAGEPPAEPARALRETLRRLDPAEALAEALVGERAWGLRMLDQMARGTLGREARERGGEAPGANATVRVMVWLNRARYVEIMETVINGARANVPYRERAAADGTEEPTEGDLGPGLMFVKMLLPVFARADRKRDHTLAEIELCAVALDLAAFKGDTGGYPAALTALPSADRSDYATDIFSGEPLRYRREEGGFVLWSLGPDLDDDGGRPRTADDSHDSDDCDLVFRCGNHE